MGRTEVSGRRSPLISAVVSPRYRCGACGNATRFDVVATRRTRAFHHFTIGGDLEIEEEDVLEERIESVTCRWCGAAAAEMDDVSDAEQLHDQPS
jgi:hypothetical protein